MSENIPVVQNHFCIEWWPFLLLMGIALVLYDLWKYAAQWAWKKYQEKDLP
jgi:hypothetical protein